MKVPIKVCKLNVLEMYTVENTIPKIYIQMKKQTNN